MNDIIETNYQSTVKRGLITDQTTVVDFYNKIWEEVEEFEETICTPSTQEELNEELADIILVCLNFARHYDIDIESELKKKIEKNFQRAN